MIIKFDHHAVATIMRETAEFDILPFFRKLKDHEINDKKSGEIVTEADIRAEKRLTKELLKLLPGSIVVGEEAVAADPTIEERLLGKKPVWVIDPVDGTRNFANGKECFCVIIALCHGFKTIAGWIYDPIAKVVYFAQQGVGAWANDRRLTIPTPPMQNNMTASLGYKRQDEFKKYLLKDDIPKNMLRYRCIGREYTDMALGKIHFGEYTVLKPWDHAAGLLLLSESGGYHAYISTQKPYTPIPTIREPVLVSTSEFDWLKLHKLFSKSNNM
jgi:fructose-1,6-bisphosphatase/inositol monophosphatase family enzyme